MGNAESPSFFATVRNEMIPGSQKIDNSLRLRTYSGEGNGNPLDILAWRIPGTGKPGGLPPMGSHRVGHD